VERSEEPSGADAPREAWAAIGCENIIHLVAVEIWLIELPFVRPVITAVGTHAQRPLVLVNVVAERDGVTVEGWGECAALADTTYDDEDALRAFDTLAFRLVPALVEAAGDGNRVPTPVALRHMYGTGSATPLAFAALEMAVADAHLRAEGRSLASVLGVEGRWVELGAVVGQAASVDALLSEVDTLVGRGYRRMKLKVGPGWDVDPVSRVVGEFPHLLVQVDANGAYRAADMDHLALLDRFGLLCLEQPFDRADLDAHVGLGRLMATPISLDESADSVEAVRHALALGACSVVGVKPSRLGGLGSALDLVASCTDAGVPLWMGGMFESGYGRGVNTTLSALPGFLWPGDLSPAALYLARDIVPPPVLNRTRPEGALVARVPDGNGMGPPPDRERFGRSAVRYQRFEGPGA
jgi:o-succinylbenzoate synthase